MPKPNHGLKKPSSLNAIDTLSLFGMLEYVKDIQQKPATLAYAELLRVLSDLRSEFGFRTADASFAAVAIDPRSESQGRFTDALTRMNITVQAVDYRHVFVSVPPDRIGERLERPLSSLAPQLAYLIGLIAERKDPEIVVVSGSFEFFWPLMDFVENRGGKAALAWWRRFVDQRWSQFGRLFEPDSPIKWYDLDPHSEAMMGLNLGRVVSSESKGPKGLGQL